MFQRKSAAHQRLLNFLHHLRCCYIRGADRVQRWPCRATSLDVLQPDSGWQMKGKVRASPEGPGMAGPLHDQAVAFHPERFSDTRRTTPGSTDSFSIFFEILT